MKKDILRVRRVKVLQGISRELGVDLDSFPRLPDEDHLQLAILEAIYSRLQERESRDDLLQRIAEIDGIGEATVGKIREGLDAS